MHRKPRSRSSLLCALGSALAFSLAAALASSGCSLIKINGKPLSELGGGGEAASEKASGAGSSGRGGGSEGPATPATPIGEASPKSAMCRSSSGDSTGTLASLEDRLAKQEPEYAAASLVDALCSTEGPYAQGRAEVRKLGQAWMARHGFDDRDVAYLYEKGRRPVEGSQELSELSGAVAEYAALSTAPSLVDALDRVSERKMSALAKTATVAFCAQAAARGGEGEPSILLAILCTRWSVDAGKALAEIDATPGLNDATRFLLRQSVIMAQARQRAYAKGLARLAAEDPGVAQVLAIADQEFKQWTTLSPRRFKLLSSVTEMEKAVNAKRRSALAGCPEKTVAPWREELRAMKLPPVPEDKALEVYVRATLGTAEGYLAYTALMLCATAELADHHEREQIAEWSIEKRRGPWSATLTQWALAGPIEFDVEGRTMSKLTSDASAVLGSGPIHRPSRGVIASIEDEDRGVKVTFKTVKEKRYGCMEWAPTNRVERVNSSGIVEYVQRCVRKGSGFMDLTPSDVRFPKAMAQGLKPGMYLVAHDGLPVVATASRSSKKPIFVLGGLLQ